MNREISTLEGFEPQLGRRVGNTTRLVDRAIQIIFNGDTCLVEDHFKNGGNTESNRCLFKKIEQRLKTEHFYFSSACVFFDRFHLLIRRVDIEEHIDAIEKSIV